MHARTLAIATLATALGTLSAPADAVDLIRHGAMPVPANRIVGAWDNQAFVGPCDGVPSAVPQAVTVIFNPGGTFVDNPRFPPQGIVTPAGTMQRSIGLGSWAFVPGSGKWSMEQRFDWYKNNVYDGYQVITRTAMVVSGDGKRLTSPVEVSRYNAAGVLIQKQCGHATATRL